MQKEDIDHMERIVASQKIRYEYMDTAFTDTVVGTNVYVPINITRLLQDLSAFEMNLLDSVNFDMHCAISIMNMFAHYKHYYLSRKAEHVTIIGYVKDAYAYTQNEDLIKMIESICEYFPGVYFMSNIYRGNSVISVCAALKYLFNSTITSNKSILHVYSVHSMDKQILMAIPAKSAFKLCKDYTGKLSITTKQEFIDSVFKTSKSYYEETMYKSELDRLIVPIGLYLGTYSCASSFDKTKYPVTFKRKHVKNRVQVIDEFLKSVYDSKSLQLSINEQFFDYLGFELDVAGDMSNFHEYEKRYDYFYQNTGFLNKIIQPLFDSWKKKIKDYAMHQESEKFKMLVKHQLYANWLL